MRRRSPSAVAASAKRCGCGECQRACIAASANGPALRQVQVPTSAAASRGGGAKGGRANSGRAVDDATASAHFHEPFLYCHCGRCSVSASGTSKSARGSRSDNRSSAGLRTTQARSTNAPAI
eukprot:521225-Prymnesium_polylepis.1